MACTKSEVQPVTTVQPSKPMYNEPVWEDYQYTPITTMPNLQATVGSIVEVPITVEQFANITAISLTIVFNPSQLTLLDVINTSNYPDLMWAVNEGKLILSAYTEPPGLAVTGTLFTLVFQCNGSSKLSFRNKYDTDCEYAGGAMQVLIDQPFANFYHNGSITQNK
jgi:hypothetical protein